MNFFHLFIDVQDNLTTEYMVSFDIKSEFDLKIEEVIKEIHAKA